MSIDVHKDDVLDLFRHGHPSVEEWEAIAATILRFSEAELYGEDCIKCNAIDDVILGQRWDCKCGEEDNREEDCFRCGSSRTKY